MSADHGDPFAPLAEGDRTAARRVRSEVRGGSAELTDKVVADCLEFAGTLAADYLAGRGIPVDALPKIDPRGDLLFHPRLWHKETKQYLPALVCRLRDETGQVVSAQRIFLQQGHPQRLDGQSAKKLTAPVAGAAVRLGKFDAEHAYLGEGVETTMSAAVVGPLALSLACCGSLRSDAVPASVRSVEILVDRGAEDRAKTVAGELQARGIEARLATVPDDLPDPEGGKADANTLLQGRGPQAVQAMLDAAVAVQEPRERALEHLAKLHPMEYDRRRSTEAKRLGVRVRTLDEEVARRRPSDTNVASGQGQPLSFEEPEPWEDEVEGASLLDDLAATFERYLALPPHASAVLALWVLHTYALSVAGTNPRLAIISPQKRCGKTTLISILSKLVLRPLPASNITPAAVFRAIDTCQPTLLLDEADTFLRENLELRGVLNSGHTRDTAFVIRSVGDDHEPRRFSTWCPMAIALIGGLPDTLADRSVVIEMRRRRRGETVERFRGDRVPDLQDLRRKAARWAADHLEILAESDPDVPVALNDRAADNWRPLIAIADAAGGAWPEKARNAATVMAADQDDDTIGVILLRDIQAIFDGLGEDRISSQDLVASLTALVDRPWAEWKRKGLTTIALSKLINPFGVSPGSIRHGPGGSATAKGYRREQFEDAWSRYVPDAGTQTVTTSHPKESATFGPNQNVTDGLLCRFENGPDASDSAACDVVTVSDEGGSFDTPMLQSGLPTATNDPNSEQIDPAPTDRANPLKPDVAAGA